MQLGWLEPHVSTYETEIGVCIGKPKVCKVAAFETSCSIYNEQDSITSILAHRVADEALGPIASEGQEKLCA